MQNLAASLVDEQIEALAALLCDFAVAGLGAVEIVHNLDFERTNHD